jgi:hypothetical protein
MSSTTSITRRTAGTGCGLTSTLKPEDGRLKTSERRDVFEHGSSPEHSVGVGKTELGLLLPGQSAATRSSTYSDGPL